MPYNGQTAGKGGHSDFVRNPDVQAFLHDCDYMRPPSDAEGKAMAASFSKAPADVSPRLPEYVLASDASKRDEPINEKLPSTQIGFIKVSHVLIQMNKYAELIDPITRFVDPFKVAELHRNASPITYTLPGSNIRYKGAKSVKDGFRHAVYSQLGEDRAGGDKYQFILTDTLFALSNNKVVVNRCPSCNSEHEFVFVPKTQTLPCKVCDAIIYMTDWLRLHEGISDFGDNTVAITRMMSCIEHLLLMAFIRQVFEADVRALSKMAFVIDGPLAIFGQPAKLHARIMAFLFTVNLKLAELKKEPLLVLGLQKTGEVMDHANMMSRFLPSGVLRILDDDYRNKYIKGSDAPAANFGNETYFGQDFLFKTERGRIFNFAIPYMHPNKKNENGANFAQLKADPKAYGSLIVRACDFIRHFELDLYDSSIVPVALAHRHASISITPGGKVLDIITKAGLSRT
ncbi:conserved hypothetical protein [Candidatus Methylobacter favarea]|uniref:NurA domain-containing protein n=1 Tax=Candidatus Methylobacter favarea TaxID=2707345 RepID=A0A8S0X2M8_9GAMM|nr:hypothetical protein [Candidatus Methylobacter favarea]CAA9892054.1 conserved hypothetical protein [Candidatus Methylobacter favarea]